MSLVKLTGSGNRVGGAFLVGVLVTSYVAGQGQRVGRDGRVKVRVGADGQVSVGGACITCVDGRLAL